MRLWLRETELVERMRARRDNPVYLPGVAVPQLVMPCEDLASALDRADLALVAVPSQFVREVYRGMTRSLAAGVPVAVACKGIEEGSLLLPLDVARAELGDARRFAVVSGPSFAAEVAAARPTAIVVASADAELARAVQQRLSSATLRLYTNTDPLGVQLAGALKNVVAIATGIGDSLGAGTNARAALITRGLAEITRLGTALGGRVETFSGLAGLGDLLLTCTGELSRNREVGRRIGRGERLGDILATSRSVAEGVQTARAARALALRSGVEMPIVEEVYRILYEGGSPGEAIERLMGRPLTSEREEPAR